MSQQFCPEKIIIVQNRWLLPSHPSFSFFGLYCLWHLFKSNPVISLAKWSLSSPDKWSLLVSSLSFTVYGHNMPALSTVQGSHGISEGLRLVLPLKITWSAFPQAGPCRASCPGPCPDSFLVSPRMENPSPPWATCASAWSPSQWKSVSCCSKGFKGCLKCFPCSSVCPLPLGVRDKGSNGPVSSSRHPQKDPSFVTEQMSFWCRLWCPVRSWLIF